MEHWLGALFENKNWTLWVFEEQFLSIVPEHVDLSLLEHTQLGAIEVEDAINILWSHLQGNVCCNQKSSGTH